MEEVSPVGIVRRQFRHAGIVPELLLVELDTGSPVPAEGSRKKINFARVRHVSLYYPTVRMDDEPIRIPLTDVFDLHSVPPRDAEAVVDEYLEEAHRMGWKAVRIIHGRGIGVQREMVRRVL